MNYKDFMGTKKAAEYLGVTTDQLRGWARSGKIRIVKHPTTGRMLFHRGDLNKEINMLTLNARCEGITLMRDARG